MSEILRIEDEYGAALVVVDEDGNIRVHAGRLRIPVNRVAERIQSAAAGGATLEQLQRGAGVVFCDDVELTAVTAFIEPEGARGGIHLATDYGGFLRLHDYEQSGRPKQLEGEGSTLRMVLFEADQVHREEEPEPERLMTPEQIRELVQGDFLARCMFEHGLIESHKELKMRFGAESWSEVDPAALYLWAVDNGVADHLPESIRRASHHEELGR